MRFMYVRGNRQNVIHGLVTSLGGNNGIVLFDHGLGSARFNLMDGCDIGLGEAGWGGDHGIKFTQSIKIDRPVPYGGNSRDVSRKSRIVVVLNTRNAEWAYVWAYEDEYLEVCAQVNKIKSAFQEGVRVAQLERQAVESRRAMAHTTLTSLGMFRISQAHQFLGESAPRPSKPFTGPMKLVDLMAAIYTEKVPFAYSQPRGINDTLTMWFERQTSDGWKRVEILPGEIIQVLYVNDGKASLDTIQPLINRLAGVASPQLATA